MADDSPDATNTGADGSSTTLFGKRQVPVVVYVLFHPDSEEGPKLADAAFAWLRLADDFGDGTAAGLPVYYRTVAHGGAVVPDIAWEDARHNFVVVLADDALTTDPAWRATLETIVERARAPRVRPRDPWIHILPVMLSRSLDQLAFLTRGHNPLRVYADSDPRLPDRPRLGMKAEERKAATEARAKAVEALGGLRAPRLRRRLTEAMVRAIRDPKAGQPPRLKVFISHAKADGLGIATRLRDGLAAVSQFEPWFDANDLAPGRQADGTMAGAAGGSTGGMIAVLTDAYPTRPWCRFEAQLARTPVLVPSLRYFMVQPTVAIQVAGRAWARTVGPMAQVLRIGWPAAQARSAPTKDERAVDPFGAEEERRRVLAMERDAQKEEDVRLAEVIDRLLLETLLAEVSRLQVEAEAERRRSVDKGPYFLGFVPDAWTLAAVRERIGPGRRPVEIVYPGHGLRRAEREELDRFARLLFPPRSTVRAFEEVLLDGVYTEGGERLDPPPLVGLSAGGEDRELWPAGGGEVHVNDLLVRLTRHLLKQGCRVAYGGSLHNPKQRLTRALLDAGEGWRTDLAFDLRPDRQDARVAEARDAVARPPLVNFAPWPSWAELPVETRGRYLGLCEFVVTDEWVLAPDADPATQAVAMACSLAAMRRRMAEACDLRVFFAGKVHHWSGLLPGIAEELLTTVDAGCPFLTFGGFGGCAGLLATFLADPAAAWPEDLTWERELQARARRDPAAAREWASSLPGEASREAFTRLRERLSAFRADEVCAGGEAVRGVPRDRWLAALAVASPTVGISLVLRSLHPALTLRPRVSPPLATPPAASPTGGSGARAPRAPRR